MKNKKRLIAIYVRVNGVEKSWIEPAIAQGKAYPSLPIDEDGLRATISTMKEMTRSQAQE